jgi:hypothetical protein
MLGESHPRRNLPEPRIRSHPIPLVIQQKRHVHITLLDCLSEPMKRAFVFTQSRKH